MPKKNPAAVALGRMSSPAKTRAARRNAQLGGRRPKFALGDRARANDHAPSGYRDRIGVVTAIGPRKSQYRVEYAIPLRCDVDEPRPPYGSLMSWWLDRA